MKVNFVMLLIALAIAALAAFGFYSGHKGEYQLLITIGSGLMLFIFLSGIIAVGFDAGGTANVRVVSIPFLLVGLVSNLIFAFFMAMAPYIIVNGIIMILYILICYSVVRALK
ncbi:MAG: hypothetical protein FWD22_03935 [Treponema sp.]|nr:hypothetical protein [Treponema sp.]